MVRQLRHRQTKGAAYSCDAPTATAPHLDFNEWELSPEMGKNGVRVSRYFQRNSNGDAESKCKFVIEGVDRYRNPYPLICNSRH